MSTRTFTFPVQAQSSFPTPAAGTFRNISTNTLLQAKPSGWPSNDIAGPFANWSGAVYAPQFSSRGGYVIHGSGHLTPGAALWAGVWVFDLDTLAWVGRNVPSQPLYETADYNGYFESTVSATLGHTSPPHTYDGLAYQTPAQGGGTKGSLLRFCLPGAQIASPRAVHRFDLSSSTAPPTRVIDDCGISTSYPMTAVDTARGGVWALNNNGASPLRFIRFSDWNISTYSVGYGIYGDNSLVYIPAPWDCLVGFGRADMANTLVRVYVCQIVNNVPQGFTQVTPTGTAVTDGRSGGVWSTLLNSIVCYAGGTTTVHKLTPPAPGNLLTGWAWSSETLTGVNGAVPVLPLDSNNAPFNNGTWSRFVEVPSLQCFIVGTGVSGPVQAWRLTGM